MKYGNRKTYFEGMYFDSIAERDRYIVLRCMEDSGEIQGLQRQVPFKIVEGKRWSDGRKRRDRFYVADFVYIKDGKRVVEDVKGARTKEYTLKRDLMKELYDIEIREVPVRRH